MKLHSLAGMRRGQIYMNLWIEQGMTGRPFYGTAGGRKESRMSFEPIRGETASRSEAYGFFQLGV